MAVSITYRTTDVGQWGAGKGGNLDAVEIDQNFYNLATQVDALGSGPQPAEIDTISVSGDQMTITLDDLTVFGPFTLPKATFTWRGNWAASTSYNTNDIVKDPATGIYIVVYDHTSDATFDPDYQPSGESTAAYVQMSGVYSLDGLSDVVISSGGPADNSILRYDASSGVGAWVDEALPATEVNAQTGTTYTLALTDANDVVTMDNASANAVTIPAESAVDYPIGTVIGIISLGAGVTSVTAAAGVTLNGVVAGSADLSGTEPAVSLVKIASDRWNMKGDHGGVS